MDDPSNNNHDFSLLCSIRYVTMIVRARALILQRRLSHLASCEMITSHACVADKRDGEASRAHTRKSATKSTGYDPREIFESRQQRLTEAEARRRNRYDRTLDMDGIGMGLSYLSDGHLQSSV